MGGGPAMGNHHGILQMEVGQVREALSLALPNVLAGRAARKTAHLYSQMKHVSNYKMTNQ